MAAIEDPEGFGAQTLQELMVSMGLAEVWTTAAVLLEEGADLDDELDDELLLEGDSLLKELADESTEFEG